MWKEGERTRAFTAEESAADRTARKENLLISEKGDTLRTNITAASAAGRGPTPGQILEAQKKRIELAGEVNEARDAWVNAGRPKADDRDKRNVKLLRAFQNAERQLKMYDNVLAQAGVTSTSVAPGSGQSDIVDVAWK